MNKAFLREPDAGDARCPRCGSVGTPVGRGVLETYLDEEQRRSIAGTAWFCPVASCPVAYFDEFERKVTTDRLARPAYPKDPAAPVCACFGLTEADVAADVAEGGVTRCRATVEKSRTAAARCATLAADGQPCVAEIQRLYRRLRGDG